MCALRFACILQDRSLHKRSTVFDLDLQPKNCKGHGVKFVSGLVLSISPVEFLVRFDRLNFACSALNLDDKSYRFLPVVLDKMAQILVCRHA
jgi:hypothetical protein